MTDTPTADVTVRHSNPPNRSGTIAKLAEALAKAQGAIKGAIKDATNPHFRSTYADLASVWEAVREPLTKNGLSIVQIPTFGDGHAGVQTILLHSSGEWLDGYLEMPISKSDAHGVGSAITYARRYALQAFAGVAPEDDDANAATGRTEAASSHQERRQETRETRDEANAGNVGEIKDWRDVTCHFGKPMPSGIKGKRVGDMTHPNLEWLRGVMLEKNPERLSLLDKKLIAAVELALSESNVKQPHPDDGNQSAGTGDDDLPMFAGEAHETLGKLIEYRGFTWPQFMEAAIALSILPETAKGKAFTAMSEPTAKGILDRWDAELEPMIKAHIEGGTKE